MSFTYSFYHSEEVVSLVDVFFIFILKTMNQPNKAITQQKVIDTTYSLPL